MSRSVLEALETEWRRMARGSQARRAVDRWTEQHPVFNGLRDLADILERRRDNRAAPAILSALAKMAADGDELAARTLLHALVPGLLRLTHIACRGDANGLDEIIRLAWERIRTYPVTRQGSVAANVILDVKQRYWDQRRANDVQTLPVADIPEANGAHVVEAEAIEHLAFQDLLDARRRLAGQGRGVVSERLWRLIVLTRLGGVPLAELAEQEGVSTTSLKNRRWRAERRLLRELPHAS